MTYRFDPTELMALRQRLRCPPNAVPDKPIDLHHPRGLTGWEMDRQRAAIAKQAEKERQERLMDAMVRQEREAGRKRVVPQGTSTITLAGDHPTIAEVIGAVCDVVGCSVAEMKSSRRDNEIVGPRHVAMMLAKILTLHSLPSIGKHFGGRDHTTVLHAIRKMALVEEKTFVQIGGDPTVLDFTIAAVRAYDAVFPGRCYRITEAVRALEDQAA